ncbi:hypothetical protein TTHERM_00051930 (macronuclear) [Tetrahymena thermophila SB210]|uniref:Uncharacterized protein n=1 Tax=Tetrahymena thermophila (strain SB210) TaxID=312017 RepID=Q23CZ6_TETTS|nr:hypothetical protein TTHERM_00051930 [Tetrahymena thermophila SB210]EAR94670.2 hypothetical protein TTHERM_00051930 [Tetrahymena thermophila SB210]|eukprot:XP_001014890.2 hypothetical protein TTHERM_00051930 [Tetrahymena thermophila SB210]
MGNSNKSKVRSISNPHLGEDQQKLEQQQPIEKQDQDSQDLKYTQVKQITQQSQQNSSQKPVKKYENSTQKSHREKRLSSEHDQRSGKNHRYGDNRQSQDSPPNKPIKTCQNVGSGGKKRKSLEDIMISEIQKLKKYQPQKHTQSNQVQSLLNYKNRLQNQISASQNNYESIVKSNQSSLLMNHLITHSRSISPQLKNKQKSISPDSSILSKSKIFIPQVIQVNDSELKQLEGLEVISSLKLMQCKNNKKDIQNQDKNHLFRSQTNPRKRNNWEMITKNFSATNRNYKFQSFNNQTYIVNSSKQNSSHGFSNLISPEMRPKKNSDLVIYNQNNVLPQLNEQNKINQQNENIPKHTPRRIEELFSIYEGGRRKISQDKNKEKQNQLMQITSYLDKKYQTNSKKKAELEKIEPYIRSKSQSNNNTTVSPRQPASTKVKKDILMPMFIVQSPQQQQEEDDFEKCCKPSSFIQTKQSYQRTQSTKNPGQIKNKMLRTQLNSSTIRSNSSTHKENIKNLSKLRYNKPYQIEFDQQQYDILNKSNVNSKKNNHIKFNEYLKECQLQQQEQQNNTFYSKKSQSFYDEALDQSKILLTNQENSTFYMSKAKNQNQQIDGQLDSEIPQNEENKTTKELNSNQRELISESREQDNNLQSFIDQSSQYGFQETNSYHLNIGYERMKIRKYQNNSQVGILSNMDIQKIYMKNPLLDVYTSTLKQNQKLNQNIQKNNLYIQNNSCLINNSMSTSNGQFIKFVPQNQQTIIDNKEYQKQQLIKTYQPKKQKQNRQQI